jgi:hypothetical protein
LFDGLFRDLPWLCHIAQKARFIIFDDANYYILLLRTVEPLLIPEAMEIRQSSGKDSESIQAVGLLT